jgi:uncharacterized tellurite resistance protein B-like protein
MGRNLGRAPQTFEVSVDKAANLNSRPRLSSVRQVNDRLLELYRGVAVHATANLEHTAALELLALVMAADRKLDQTEIDAIRDISDDWRDGDFTFEKYLGPAIVRAQEAITNDEVTELIDDIDSRINSRVLRRALFSAAREVAGVDDEVSPEEGSILAEVAVRFG